MARLLLFCRVACSSSPKSSSRTSCQLALRTKIGHNSEAFLFAILVPAEIQVLRGLTRTRFLLGAMVIVGMVSIALGLMLKSADIAPTLVTLNEPIIAAGFVLLYLCLPRSRAIAIAIAVLTVLYIIIFFNTGFVLDQAESLVPLALVGPALDIFDRTILQPFQPEESALRVGWMPRCWSWRSPWSR